MDIVDLLQWPAMLTTVAAVCTTTPMRWSACSSASRRSISAASTKTN